ncbi:hypothetical protein ACHAXA_001187 [Cyclostephanos tholiformis]|uniref:Uncharacterized protein n=1 Tax=Cyclostephanos tholiformis TaxID=382380 RepID=A0ABD3SQ07_9STRA
MPHNHPLQHPVDNLAISTTGLEHPMAVASQHFNYRGGSAPTAAHNNVINGGVGRGRSFSVYGNKARANTRACGGDSFAWKKLAQCSFVFLILGYLLFFFLAQNHYLRNEEDLGQYGHWGRRIPLLPSSQIDHDSYSHDGGYDGDYAGMLPPPRRRDGDSLRGIELSGNIISSIDRLRLSHDDSRGLNTIDHHTTLDDVIPANNMLGDMRDYLFKVAGRRLPQQQQRQRFEERAVRWSTKDPLRNALMETADRRKDRRLRTKPPKNVSNHHRLWYKLGHSSIDTIASLQSRWKENVASNAEAAATNHKQAAQAVINASKLCGAHAREAAKYHPENFLSSSYSNGNKIRHEPQHPLGPQSRVLISGILSPLGLHLALALFRQCGVVNFLGLDTMFPNDPLIRLEHQERLAVLMQELGDFGELRVPFLGLESNQASGGDQSLTSARTLREKMLLELRKLHQAENGTVAEILDKVGQYARPYRQYGIPLTPGTTRDGSGHLDVVLEYRPTHIVHLAGTQSDSLLSANYHAKSDGASPSHRNTIHQNKDEEEDDILKEGVSARPHLYDLRMGVTGMEQLLSGAVAQMMIPPKAGPAIAITPHMSESDMAKMTKPHIVYASSYDAIYFRDTTVRLQQHARKTVIERDNLGNTFPPPPKTPSRGIHGMSRLIDEILASSYHALHNIPSIGLRFDVIYGPRGFGVPSTSIPIYHADRIKTTKRGVSPDVDLAETAVRSLYKAWMEAINTNEDAKRRGAEKETEGDIAAKGEEDATPGRRLEEARRLNLIEESGWMHLAHERRDFVFVDDAVDAIVSAMQYRPVNKSPTTFNIGSGEMSDLASLTDEIQKLVIPDREYNKKTSISKNVIDVEQSRLAHAASLSSHDYLRWSAKTSFKVGAAKLLAWHLDRAMPFFRPVSSSDNEVDYSTSQSQRAATGENILLPLDGEKILSRRGITSCSYDDPTCLRELHTSYPCSSECSTQSCTPSVFDGVIKISHDLTEDCDVVLYTMALGYDVEYLGLETEYSDGEEQEKWWETTVCTIAFVPSESTLVKKIISQVPQEKLKNRGITPASSHNVKVKRLNGYLAHHGWVLILVDDATKPLTAEDLFVPKLSPARLFHSTVRKAMFVDENFSHTPYPEDAQFLTSETSRGVLPKRTISGPDAKGHKTKYKLPEEPQRRAVLLVSPMRQIPDLAGDQMPLKEITLSFMKDTGLEPNETEEIRTQREFYERARSSINSMDLRSLNPTVRHKIEINNFIRSKWIVHHLKLEEGHQLRCEWYREHIRWGTLLDQLSFAYVMAKRELTRKIIMKQPLPPTHEEPTILQQIIRLKSDAHEWHPIFSAEGAVKPFHHSEISLEHIPLNLQDLPDNEITAVNAENTHADVGSTFYVRIMSDTQMTESRKKWMKARNNHRKYVSREMAKEEAN